MKFPMKHMRFSILKTTVSYCAKILIQKIAKYAGLNLLDIAYNNIGILKFQNHKVSGEHFLVTQVLKNNLTNIVQPVIFDVGANLGSYSRLLSKVFPNAQIHAFEPNENTFKQLVYNAGNSFKCINLGMDAEEKTKDIFVYSSNLASSHASIYKEAFTSYHKRKDIVKFQIQMSSIDLYCEKEKIRNIDFLKIDTEGNEFNVLSGAKSLLAEKKINFIQFEFGECDIFSRFFLHDFYSILVDYNIYRLDSNRLIPIFEYSPANEIFRYQNFLAINKNYPFDFRLYT